MTTDTVKIIIESLDAKRFLIFVIVACACFFALALLLIYDPVIAKAPNPATLGKDTGSWWDEDSYVEYATAGFAALAAVLWAWAISRARSRGILRKRSDYALTLLLAFMMFLLAGEEISWGQRIINVETPEYIGQINTQNEINIHNVGTGIPIQIFLYIGTLFWGVLLPLLHLSSRLVRRLAWTFRCPIPPVYLASLFVGAPLFRVIFISGYGNFAREGMELLFTIAFVAVALHAVVRPDEAWMDPIER